METMKNSAALADVAVPVSAKNLRTLKELSEEAKWANRKAQTLQTSSLMDPKLSDTIIRLKRNANSLTMLLGLVQDAYINMRSEIHTIFKEIEKEEKEEKAAQKAKIRQAQNQRYNSKKRTNKESE